MAGMVQKTFAKALRGRNGCQLSIQREEMAVATKKDLSEIRRRDFLAVVATAAATGASSWALADAGGDMYGLIGKMTAVSGKRDELIAILLAGTSNMPGCLSYIIAKDASDADGIWISEAWDSKASHEASLSLPSVKESMAKGRPLIAGFSNRVVTTPVGGVGLGRPKRR